MRYIKKYEKIKNQNSLKHFLEKFEIFEKGVYAQKLKNSSDSIYNYLYKWYDVPKKLEDELNILVYLYEYSDSWKSGDREDDNYTRRKIKQYVEKLVLNKINDDMSVYLDIKNCVNKHKNFINISNTTIRYIFFFLNTIERKFSKEINKYNL